jgi:hypothetical protein
MQVLGGRIDEQQAGGDFAHLLLRAAEGQGRRPIRGIRTTRPACGGSG